MTDHVANPKLSVLVAGIRRERWPVLVDSIARSFSQPFEVILCGPFPPTGLTEMLYIEDWGTPTRCYQRALLNAEAPIILWAFDDGVFEPGALDRSYALLENQDPMLAVTHRYIEGVSSPGTEGLYPAPDMHEDAYYRFGHHRDMQGLHIPGDYLLMNSGLCGRQMALAVGGWDCQFEAPASAFADFAARLQNAKARVQLQDHIAVRFGHMPGTSGDHGPIHNAYFEHDFPLFKQVWSAPDALTRSRVDIENWRQSPARWERRFGKA